MFFSRSTIFVVFSAVLLTLGAYGQDDGDCGDPEEYLQNLQNAVSNIQDMAQDVMDNLPMIAQGLQDSASDLLSTDDMQDALAGIMTSMQAMMDNVDDMQDVAKQTMDMLKTTLQGAMTNPMVVGLLNDFAGNTMDMISSSMDAYGAIQDKLGDLAAEMGETGSGLMDILTGPDMTANLKDIMDNGIGYGDAVINKAVSDGMSNIFGMLNDGLSSLGGTTGLADMPATLISALGSMIPGMSGFDPGTLASALATSVLPAGIFNAPGGLDAGSLMDTLAGALPAGLGNAPDILMSNLAGVLPDMSGLAGDVPGVSV